MMSQRLAEAYYGFKCDQDGKGAILSYSGFVSESILFSLGETLRRRVEHEDSDQNHTKRLFSVFVEQVQNVIRYSAEQLPPRNPQETPLGSGLIVVGMEEQAFFVVCANTITLQQKEQLEARLTALAAMDKDALRAVYRKKLKEPPEEGSLGASLGLIEVARRSSRPIEFDFLDLQEERFFFCLKVFV
ncbi:MAG TPA: SiaB family protein kinase [Kiloniellales bacterium]|jgi:hypothetical protein|nr:SiaB family protein kinase [Kiloniellales bacterium]